MLEVPPARRRSIAVFFVLVFVAFFTFYVSQAGWDLKPFRAFLGSLLAPTQIALSKLEDRVTSELNEKSELESLRLELEKARQELLAYKTMYNELEIIRREKEHLEKLLEYQHQLSYATTPAKIIGRDPQNLFQTLTISKGTRHGIQSGAPVIGFSSKGYALLGKIYLAGPTTSQVLTILDPRCQVGVLVENTGDTGVMRGQLPAQEECLMEYLDHRATGLEGKRVVTSGMGEKYPKGIPVGTLSQVVSKNFGLFQSWEVLPEIPLHRVTDVFVFVE